MPATVSLALASLTSTTTTCAPSRANTSAAARPMPDAPAVTSAILPWRSIWISVSLRKGARSGGRGDELLGERVGLPGGEHQPPGGVGVAEDVDVGQLRAQLL